MLKKNLSKAFAATAILGMMLTIVPAVQAMESKSDWILRTRAIYLAPDDSYSGPLDLEVKGDAALDIDIVRFLTPSIALELTALVSSHEVKDGTLNSLGSVRLLPPVLTLQYHFLPDGKIRPYIGAGINYTIFYDETGALDELDVDLKDGFHLAAQAGADIMLTDTLSLNLDLKYVDLEADIDSNAGDLGNVDINPWIFGVGLGCHF